MAHSTNFIEKARRASAREKQSLDREIALDRTSGFFSRAGFGWRHALLQTLAEAMAHFWIAVFPFVLVGGIVVFAVSSWLGISIWGAISLLAFLGIGLAALAVGMR